MYTIFPQLISQVPVMGSAADSADRAADNTDIILRRQAENSTNLLENQKEIQEVIQDEFTNSIQSNAIAVLTTLIVATGFLGIVYLKVINPKIDRAFTKFSDYLDRNIATTTATLSLVTDNTKNLVEHRTASKEYLTSLQYRLDSLEKKVEDVKAEIVQVRILIVSNK